jgi:hypothetical protein
MRLDFVKLQAGDHLVKAYDLNKLSAGLIIVCK